MSGPAKLSESENRLIRDYAPADAQAVLAVNAANVPEVGPMDEAKLALFVEIAPFFKVVEVGGVVVGIMVGLSEQSINYPSPNYRWFNERHGSFAYVDRIALVENGRGQGWGQRLYGEFEQWARDTSRPWLCAEVNTEPDNPASHRFHLAFGFDDVAHLRPYGPDEEVAMYEKSLSE